MNGAETIPFWSMAVLSHFISAWRHTNILSDTFAKFYSIYISFYNLWLGLYILFLFSPSLPCTDFWYQLYPSFYFIYVCWCVIEYESCKVCYIFRFLQTLVFEKKQLFISLGSPFKTQNIFNIRCGTPLCLDQKNFLLGCNTSEKTAIL